MSATGSPSSRDSAAGAPPGPQGIRIDCGWTLDARRAAFQETASLLAVADLHLGYAWAQRSRGLLLPVDTPDTSTDRLAELCNAYQPRTVVILGDLIHRATALEALRPVLETFCAALQGRDVVLCSGNHDRGIRPLIARWQLPIRAVEGLDSGRFHLRHGDDPHPEHPAEPFTLAGDTSFVVQGHEHPALELGDGRLTRVRVPCFLTSDDTLLLPAFSDWASGCRVGRDPFLGSRARGTRFHTAYACMGPRLLPIPLDVRTGAIRRSSQPPGPGPTSRSQPRRRSG
ncbi:MAG: metallophosphoesterase [Verrucomicrobiales bacterium]|nr:metallophosphoesterase [Verrucomicrobiales bacterium]